MKRNFANRLLWSIRLHPGRKYPELYDKSDNATHDKLTELNNRSANVLLTILALLLFSTAMLILSFLRLVR